MQDIIIIISYRYVVHVKDFSFWGNRYIKLIVGNTAGKEGGD